MWFSQKTRSPLDGFPKTEVARHNANDITKITVRFLAHTPFRKYLAEGFAVLFTFLMVGYAGWRTHHADHPGLVIFMVCVATYLIGIYPVLILCREALKKSYVFVFTEGTFSYRTFWGWKQYDRKSKHSFSLGPHRWKRGGKYQYANSKVKPTRDLDRYRNRSHDIWFEYGGQQLRVASIYGDEKPDLVLGRFKTVDAIMDRVGTVGHGLRLDAGDDWTDMPGDLPDSL